MKKKTNLKDTKTMITKIFIISIVFFFTMSSISSAVQSNKSATENNNLYVDSLSLKDQCKILFIGSSYFNVNNLPRLFEQLTLSAGKDVYIDHIGKNGMYLDNHASSALTELKINETDWDYIVLQGVGSLMAYPTYYTNHQEYPALETLWYKIHRHCESTKMVYCMPWAFEDGMTWYQNWTDTYADMQLKIYETTLNYSRNIGFMIAPVGFVWSAVLQEKNYPLHYLHSSDWNHPSLKGSYLMSCVIYSTLFQHSSVGLSNITGIAKNETIYFQTLASRIVLNNLNLWNIEKKPPLYVDDDNIAGPWDGTINYPFQHIQNAIDNASAGDAVFVFKGIYYENVVINKSSISLIGEVKNTTVIDGDKKGDSVCITSEYVVLCNFTITHGDGDNFIKDLFRAGIRITSSNTTIEENIIINNRVGIFGLRVTNITIRNNLFYNDGITFSPYENKGRPLILEKYFIHTIQNNIVNGKPLYYYKNQSNIKVPSDVGQLIAVNCVNFTVRNASFTNVDNVGILFAFCSQCTIEHSMFSENGSAWIFHSDFNVFQCNTMIKNFHGICLDYSSTSNIIQSNTISQNQQTGVMLEYFSNNNKILKNNFIQNRICNGYPLQSFNNIWTENYWDDWVGLHDSFLTVFPKIIIGQCLEGIRQIPLMNFDWQPAKEPYDIPGMCLTPCQCFSY